MVDIPNCPLCGSEMTEARNARSGWLYCAAYVRDFTCVMPVVKEYQLRALAAMRKPLTEQEADVLVVKHHRAVRSLVVNDGPSDRAHVAEAADALRAALTGKR